MATRPSWTGHIRFSLVNFPVELYSGSRSTRNIPLRQLHKTTGKRVHNQPVVDGVGPIKKDTIIKGYEYKKDKYVVLTPDELDKIKIASKKTIDIAEFVDIEEIDAIYYDRPYYVIPKGDVAMDAYSVLQQAMKKTGKVAIGEVVFSGKEHLVAIRPYGKGMMLETLRYSDEVRSAHSYFEDFKQTKVSAEELDLAVTLIKKKSSPFDVTEYDDSYETALHELIDRKLKKLPIREEKDDYDNSNVISLMDALKKSVKGKTIVKQTTKKAKNTTSKKASKKPASKKPVKKAATKKKKRAA